MSKEEIKQEINNVLDKLSDSALEELLVFLKELDLKTLTKSSNSGLLYKILLEDKELLAKLAL